MWPCRSAGIIISPSARNLTVGAVADADTKQEAASKGESGGSKSFHFVAQVPSHHRWPLTLGLWAIGHVELRLSLQVPELLELSARGAAAGRTVALPLQGRAALLLYPAHRLEDHIRVRRVLRDRIGAPAELEIGTSRGVVGF